jgi:orotidine-5'-phosphate decarboxylase
MTFGTRLTTAFETYGHLCVGIDPHASLMASWGLDDTADGLRDFGLRVVEAAAGEVGIIKPQAGFFERHGSAGLAAFESVLVAARAAGLLVIGDAKRGDIGSTMDGYAEGWLTTGKNLEVDSLTVNGYLGIGALAGTAELARANGNGLLVLSATSNPEARSLQQAVQSDGCTVAAGIVAGVKEWNEGTHGLGSFGVVIGATVNLADAGIDSESLVGMPILAPGFGFQGTPLRAVRTVFGPAAHNVIMSVSRSVLGSGPAGLADAIRAEADLARAALSA